MKIFSILLILVSLSNCQEAKTGTKANTLPSSNSAGVSGQDNFDDIEKLGKKDESCATEEEIKESFKPKPKETPKAFQLQGGDPGCTTDGAAH